MAALQLRIVVDDRVGLLQENAEDLAEAERHDRQVVAAKTQ